MLTGWCCLGRWPLCPYSIVPLIGTGLGISGALSGDFCTYSASLERGEGNSQDISTLPGPQTTSPASGMLAQFTGLAIDNWEIKLEASCAAGASALKVFGATAEGWIGNTGDNVSNSTVDDMSTVWKLPSPHTLNSWLFCFSRLNTQILLLTGLITVGCQLLSLTIHKYVHPHVIIITAEIYLICDWHIFPFSFPIE